MQNNCLSILFFGCIAFNSLAQKKSIDHTAYKNWNRTEQVQLSSTGKYITYERNPLKGDGYLFLFDTKSMVLDSFARGENAFIAKNETFIALTITPGYDTLRNCELHEIEKKKWPKDSLFILSSNLDSITIISQLKAVHMASEGSVIGFTKEKEVVKPDKKKKKWFKREKKKEKPVDSDGYPLIVWTPEFNFRIENVTDFEFEKTGKFVSLIQHVNESADSFSLQIMTVESEPTLIFESKGNTALKLPVWNSSGEKMAFLASKDSNEQKQYELHVFDIGEEEMWVIGDTLTYDFDTTMGVTESRDLSFIENTDLLYFGVSERVTNNKDTLLENEKSYVDIWHYNDKYIQPQQLIKLYSDGPRTKLYVFNADDKTLFPLSNDTLNIEEQTQIKGNRILATCNQAYALSAQWKSPALEDIYAVSLKTGKTTLVKRAVAYHNGLSPKGRYFAYFDAEKKQHMLKDIDKDQEICMTCNLTDVNWTEDINGQPMLAGPMDIYGYDRNELTYFFQSKYDIWGYDIEKKKLLSLTERKGEKKKIRFSLLKWNTDSVYIDLRDSYIKGFDELTKRASIYSLYENNDFGLYLKKEGDFKFFGIDRSSNGKLHMIRTMTVSEYPEVRILDKDFKNEKIISTTNQQQSNFNWAKVELVRWKAFDKLPLEGLLYSPENIDSTKKYPLLVYFYELNSDNLHNYNSPRPSASTINPIEYASAGYFVLIPDIRYTHPGRPAKSAYNCIVSGTEFVMRNFPIDSLKIGLQGQSWGGYQTAQLITMTKRYAAAMAGAPVSNMFSAYGGIRWGSGLNRQFQYESQQSRIGKTIWEAPELYNENSPLFHLPNVYTPLLIMHNDEDGAVPWYQGIELYNGMRRLQKPCWLLNYNGEDHNLTRLANKYDLSIRMRQFFDHYLKNAPMPIWMREGVSAEKKEKTKGYETD